MKILNFIYRFLCLTALALSAQTLSFAQNSLSDTLYLEKAVITAFPKESNRERKQRMRTLLDKIHNRLPVDYPLSESRYKISSDILILNEGQVVTFDNLQGTLIELPRMGKGKSDSIRIAVTEYTNYMDSDIRKGIQTFEMESLNKNEKKAVSWATKDQEYEKTLPHRLLWKVDARRIFLQVYQEEKYWNSEAKDSTSTLLFYQRKYNFLGIIVATMDITMEIDSHSYSIKGLYHRIILKANIPFGYKLSEAELAVLNICNVQGTDLEKFKAKKVDAHVEGRVLLRNNNGRMIPTEKYLTSDVTMENRKGTRASFEYQSNMKVSRPF